MTQPYFDRRAMLGLGWPNHVVDAIEAAYDRTGGSSDVNLTLADIEALFLEAQTQDSTVRKLREAVRYLAERLEAAPAHSHRDLYQRIEQLELANAQMLASRRELLRRIEQLEALTA